MRPSRRDLRLAREAQLRDVQVTEVIELPPVAPRATKELSFFRRLFKEAKNPATAGVLSAVVAGSAVTGILFGSLYSASAVQGAQNLATTTVATPQPTVPDTLKKTS
ncbi:hypothetical protein, partial [Trueperella bernardiae]|uniref:hypothetical protein n=1 Tax=Trueperella bernardiae TaxID=59561 RepID=UPI002889DE03